MTRLKVVKRGFSYPADAGALATLRQYGGLSKLPKGVTVQFKRVEIGDFCDDMPAESAAIYLERGDIARVTVEATKPEPKRKGAA